MTTLKLLVLKTVYHPYIANIKRCHYTDLLWYRRGRNKLKIRYNRVLCFLCSLAFDRLSVRFNATKRYLEKMKDSLNTDFRMSKLVSTRGDPVVSRQLHWESGWGTFFSVYAWACARLEIMYIYVKIQFKILFAEFFMREGFTLSMLIAFLFRERSEINYVKSTEIPHWLLATFYWSPYA